MSEGNQEDKMNAEITNHTHCGRKTCGKVLKPGTYPTDRNGEVICRDHES